MYTMIGTPQFSAIEILRDEKYGPQVDLWSCGVIAYNLLTGQLPFSVNEVLQTFACGEVEVPYPSAWWASTSKEAIQFTKQLLCSDPQARVSAAGALCSPWLTQDSEHVWSHLLPKLETTRDDARISFGTGSVSREQRLIAAAISRTAKKRWRTSAISICLLLRLGALDMTRSQMDPPLLAMSSISSDASCGDSDWDYSEANFDPPSEMSSFDSVVSDVSVSSPRAVSRAREDGVSTELAALKWQESVMLSTEIDRTKSRRERAPLASNFARVSKTGGAGGRGFQRKRESIAMQPPPVTTEASSTRSVDFDIERQHSPSEASERQKRNWASSRILPGMRAILKHKMKL
jgi:serine/threonine protein kinase